MVPFKWAFIFSLELSVFTVLISTVLLSNPFAFKKIWGLFLFILLVWVGLFFFFSFSAFAFVFKCRDSSITEREGGQQGPLDC